MAAAAGVNGSEGQLVMRGGFLRGKKVLVSGSATADAVARALATEGGSSGHRQALEEVQVALARFTTALFGRDEKLDDTALGESLSDSFRVVRRLKLENLWLREEVQGRDAVRDRSGKSCVVEIKAAVASIAYDVQCQAFRPA